MTIVVSVKYFSLSTVSHRESLYFFTWSLNVLVTHNAWLNGVNIENTTPSLRLVWYNRNGWCKLKLSIKSSRDNGKNSFCKTRINRAGIVLLLVISQQWSIILLCQSHHLKAFKRVRLMVYQAQNWIFRELDLATAIYIVPVSLRFFFKNQHHFLFYKSSSI